MIKDINKEIYNHYSSLIDSDTKKMINELNINLYGLTDNCEDFSWGKYAKKVNQEINDLQEKYYNHFCDYWVESLNDINESEYEDFYHITLNDIRTAILGSELANTI